MQRGASNMTTELVDINWLVHERSRIQGVSVKLLNLMRAKPDEIEKYHLDAALLMVGAAFSLWRAVFLTRIDRTATKNFEMACGFLDKFVRHKVAVVRIDYLLER